MTQKQRERIERQPGLKGREGFQLLRKGMTGREGWEILNNSDIPITVFEIYLRKTKLTFMKIFLE